MAQFRVALKIHKGYAWAHDGLAWALWKLGDFPQAEEEFRRAIYWAGGQEQPEGKFYADLGWFYLDRERWQDAIYAFESARDENLDYFGNYWGIGKALMGMKDYRAAADSLRSALDKEPNLKPPASEEIPELLRQCLEHLKRGH